MKVRMLQFLAMVVDPEVAMIAQNSFRRKARPAALALFAAAVFITGLAAVAVAQSTEPMPAAIVGNEKI